MAKVLNIKIEDLVAGKKYICEDYLEDKYSLVYQGGDKMFNTEDREVLLISADIKRILAVDDA